MRDLVIERIQEIATCCDLASVNAMMRVMGCAMLADFDDQQLSSALLLASDQELLTVYDLLSTDSAEWEIMYGFTEEDCII